MKRLVEVKMLTPEPSSELKRGELANQARMEEIDMRIVGAVVGGRIR